MDEKPNKPTPNPSPDGWEALIERQDYGKGKDHWEALAKMIEADKPKAFNLAKYFEMKRSWEEDYGIDIADKRTVKEMMLDALEKTKSIETPVDPKELAIEDFLARKESIIKEALGNAPYAPRRRTRSRHIPSGLGLD